MTTAPGIPSSLVERDPIWAHLARPFAPDWIEKLPRNIRKGDTDKGTCNSNRYSVDGVFCGGYHARSIHLDYVGHAGITMRLNEDVGPENWSLEPLGTNEQGLPIFTASQFWVKLTILGFSKIDLAESFNSTQEAWGDGLRRAAMRFGIGTDLWSKSDHAFNLRLNTEQVQEVPRDAPPPDHSHIDALKQRLGALNPDEAAALRTWWGTVQLPKLESLSPEQAVVVTGELDRMQAVAEQATLAERLGAQKVDEEATA